MSTFYKVWLAIMMIWINQSLSLTAQDDVFSVSYGEKSTLNFTPELTNLYLQFEGEAGELIYVVANEEDIIFGAELEIDLRDAVGRSVGYKGEHFFDPYIFAELPSSGVFTIAVAYTEADEAGDVTIFVDKTVNLSETKVTKRVNDDGLPVIFGIDETISGKFRLDLERLDGDMNFEFAIYDNSGFIGYEVIGVNGAYLNQASLNFELSKPEEHIAILESSLFNSGTFVEIEISMSPSE